MKLYYVRHGEPIYNPDSLTELGEKQAEAVGKRLNHIKFDRIFASTSNRAIMTGTPLAKLQNIEIEKLAWANEGHIWHMTSLPKGDGNNCWGCTSEKYRQLFNSKSMKELGMKWYNHDELKDTNIPKETPIFYDEVDNFMLRLGFKHNREEECYEKVSECPQNIALFAHQGCSWAFMSALLDIPYPYFCTHFDIQHSGVTVIEFNENHEKIYPKILQYSNDSHIYKENLPLKYSGYFDI